MSEWQPIETAPKDGTQILAWNPDWDCPSVVFFDSYEDETWWAFADKLLSDIRGRAETTHWMPIPKPPKVEP